MSFPSGSVSFRRFAVVGSGPRSVDQALLDKFSEHALRPTDVGTPEEIEYGWSGGWHVLDGSFAFEHNVFADALHVAMRVDVNKVPAELKKAYQFMEEEAVAAESPSGFVSKRQKREVKDVVRRKLDDDLRSGKYRRSKLAPVLWDVPNQLLYCPAPPSVFEKLAELFERTVGLTLVPLTAGSLALRMLEPRGRRRDYEDLRPTRFVQASGGESEFPEYPWAAKGPEPKDFLGNEFLLWLWHEAERRSAVIGTHAVGDVSLYIDRALDLDCAYGQTGRDSLRGDAPSRMPEAKDALRSGKVPRKSGLVLEASRQQFALTLAAESLAVSSAKLPEVEDAESPRVLFEERVGLLRELVRVIDALFHSFVQIRASSSWEGQVTAIRKWIVEPAKKVAAA